MAIRIRFRDRANMIKGFGILIRSQETSSLSRQHIFGVTDRQIELLDAQDVKFETVLELQKKSSPTKLSQRSTRARP